MSVNVNSEIGKLKSVILHEPGNEIENMTPENAERALYSDILNLSIALKEHKQFSELLKKITEVHFIKDLLIDTLQSKRARVNLINSVLNIEKTDFLGDLLYSMTNEELTSKLIEGIPLEKDTLTRFIDNERFAIKPLHNFFFTRDGATVLNDKVLISQMANKIRERESIIYSTIFRNHPDFDIPEFSYRDKGTNKIEGGDIIVVSNNLFIIGMGSRTNSKGIDELIEAFWSQEDENNTEINILVQELPNSPESFIHLDMIFTIIDYNTCIYYEPIFLNSEKFHTFHIKADKNKTEICKIENLFSGLQNLGIDLKKIKVGGSKDLWIQEREQWHSGANFLAVEPGKIIGYERNTYTIEELNKNGYYVIKASEIINDKKDISNYQKAVITLEGSELPRGGGGPRCMSMPVKREMIIY
ncbi:arginine deiminase family protein [Bacteroidota bacterium]